MDFHGFSFDIIRDGVTNEFSDEVLDVVTLLNSFFHLCDHLLSNELGLGVGGVRSLSNLLSFSMGVTNAEKSKEVSVFGFNISEGFNETAPLSDRVKSLISVDVESVETGVTVGS